MDSSIFHEQNDATGDKSVTYRKERPIAAIGAVGARGVHHSTTCALSTWVCTAGAATQRLSTMHMSLSAPALKTRCSKLHVVHKRIVPIMECDCICTRRTAQVQTK